VPQLNAAAARWWGVARADQANQADNRTSATAAAGVGSLTGSVCPLRQPVSFRAITEQYPRGYAYSDLAAHPAVVLLPYSVSLMSYAEYAHTND
jgi:hypothetical protein